ncbi:MAG: DUF6580 family putative transport protein [Planctomycetota bacterium]
MRRITLHQLLLAFLLVTVGVSLRMLFIEIPNFAPVAALALIAGFMLPSCALAVAVPISVMVITDLMVGMHQPLVMMSVYAMLAFPALIGRPLKKWAPIRSLSSLNTWRSLMTLCGCALLSSLMFFLVTNLACWRFSGWYPLDADGLISCLVAAVPFFRFTLAGDFVFTIGFFTVYAACVNLYALTMRSTSTAPERLTA